MTNIAHPGDARGEGGRLTSAQAQRLRQGLLRTALFVAAFVAVVALGGQLG